MQPFIVTVHSVDNVSIMDSVVELNKLGIEGVEFRHDMALDLCVRGFYSFNDYVAHAEDSLDASLYLYLHVDPKKAAKRYREAGYPVPQNHLQLSQLKYVKWADQGAELKKCFALRIDDEQMTEHEIRRVLTDIIDIRKKFLISVHIAEDRNETV